jgi:hypothetical protein
MPDAFLLLTPIFLLGVVALLGFVGCAAIVDIDGVTYQGPASLFSLDPPSRDACGPAFTLVVRGRGFRANPTLSWGTRPALVATSVKPDGTEMTVSVPADYLDQVGPVALAVLGTDDRGQLTSSNPQAFTVNTGKIRDVIFSPKPAQVDTNNLFTGAYGGLDLSPTSGWRWHAPKAQRNIQGSIGFTTAGNVRVLGFENGASRILISLQVYYDVNDPTETAPADVELRDVSKRNPPVTDVVRFSEGAKEIVTGWTMCVQQIEVTFRPPGQRAGRGDLLGISRVRYAPDA